MKMGRRIIQLGTVLLVVLAFFILNGEVSGKTITVDKSGGADYRRIQGAIDAANPWDTIVVRDGTYYENIEINNNLTLKGESKESTIIYGDVKITAGNVKVMGFTITNSSSYAISCYGIDHTLHYVTIKENKIANGKYGGIYISRSLKTTVADNVINNNGLGVYLCEDSGYITVTGNTISNNSNGGVRVERGSNGHFIYHNNFIENNPNAVQEDKMAVNYWDSGEEGNYWGDYIGKDEDGDGIGDTPYFFEFGVDGYPLMEPWREKSNKTPGFEIVLLLGAIALVLMSKKMKR